jgi:hypothetical protein
MVKNKVKREVRRIYCKCEHCENYFDVTGIKRRKYCSKSCVNKAYYERVSRCRE